MPTLPLVRLPSAPPLEEKAPPEKTVETLFLHYLLLCFPLGEASLYAPSSREEYVDGYDARVLGPSAFWELFLQFKRPRLTDKGFAITLTPHQHRRLRQYPPQTAYYIAATFRSVQEVMEAQRTIMNPRAFLSRFIAIDIACLEDDTCFVKYARSDTPTKGMPIAAAYKSKKDDPPAFSWMPRTRKASHMLFQPCYVTATDLLDRFTSRRAGSAILLRRGQRGRTVSTVISNNNKPTQSVMEKLPNLNLWGDDLELLPDEIELTEGVRRMLEELSHVVGQERVMVLDRKRAEERFSVGEDKEFSGGYSLRLPTHL